jgi:hypothetical protein
MTNFEYNHNQQLNMFHHTNQNQQPYIQQPAAAVVVVGIV